MCPLLPAHFCVKRLFFFQLKNSKTFWTCFCSDFGPLGQNLVVYIYTTMALLCRPPRFYSRSCYPCTVAPFRQGSSSSSPTGSHRPYLDISLRNPHQSIPASPLRHIHRINSYLSMRKIFRERQFRNLLG